MATYLQGVTDYIPDYQPFQPDYNFYANVLQTKQSQYDKNYTAINNLYADLYNAPVTHNLNKEKKDVLLKNIDTNLKKVSNLDLSLEQNVNAATQVFKPFYEDKYLMKDMAWTKNTYNVLGRSQALQNSTDENIRKQYWPTGIKAINYKIQDFANSTLDETLNISNVRYTPYTNSVNHYLDMAKKLGITAQSKYNVDRNGQKNPLGDITITQKNGSLIIPTLQEMFTAEYSKNPQLQEIYREQAYVDRKDWINQHAVEYNNDMVATEKAYLQKKYDYITNIIDKQNQQASENLNATKNKSDSVDNDVEQGDVNPKQTSYQEALASGATVQEAIAISKRKLNSDLNDGDRTVVTEGNAGGLNLENLNLARMRVDAGVASLLANKDVNAAAKIYSLKNYSYEEDLSKLGLERIRSANRKAEIELNASLKKAAQANDAYIKWGLKNGKFEWKQVDPNDPLKGGYIAVNENYDKSFKETSSDPGSTTENPVDLAKYAAEQARKIESEYTDDFYNNAIQSAYNLYKTGQLTGKELTMMLGREGKVSLRRYIQGAEADKDYLSRFERVYADENGQMIGVMADGTESSINPNQLKGDYSDELAMNFRLDGRDPDSLVTTGVDDVSNQKNIAWFEDAFKTWEENKTKGRELFKGTFFYKGFNDWLAKNGGHKIAKEWSTNENLQKSILNFETYNQFQDANEKIYEINSKKVIDHLESVLRKNYGDVLSQKQIEELADYYKTQKFDGADAKRAIQDGKEYIMVGNKYYDTSKDLPAFLAQIGAQEEVESLDSPYSWKINSGSAWKNTKLSGKNWKDLNEYINKDADMRAIKSQYGIGTTSTLGSDISSPDYYALKSGVKGATAFRKRRDELAREFKRLSQQGASVAAKDRGASSKTNSMANLKRTLDAAYNDLVMDPNKSTGLLSMVNASGIESGKNRGKAALAADQEARYVNLQDPSSVGFKEFGEFIRDLNVINFNQAGAYRVSAAGLMKTEAMKDGKFKHDIDPNQAVRLVETLFMNANKAGQKIDPVKIKNSQIAMEDYNTGGMTIFLPRKFLEENIKTVPYQNYEGETDDKAAITKVIDDIMANGLTFIAPKAEWNNTFFTGNQPTALELALTALGSIEYQHPNNAGSYEIRAVSDVPGSTHMGTYSFKYVQPDGTIATSTQQLYTGINRSGSTIEDIQQQMYADIAKVAMINQQMYEQFYKSGNQQAIDAMTQAFGYTPSNQGFSYGNK